MLFRSDTVLVQLDPNAVGMLGMTVVCVRAFLSLAYGGTRYECALVEWFELVSDEPDPVTGMWLVKPDVDHGIRATSVIPISSIIRGCQLIGVYGCTQLPVGFSYNESLDAFRRYYVNWYVDYHAHETVV